MLNIQKKGFFLIKVNKSVQTLEDKENFYDN